MIALVDSFREQFYVSSLSWIQFVGVTRGRGSDHKSLHFHKMKSLITQMQFWTVKRVQARQPACVTLTSGSIWPKFHIGVSIHVLDYVNLTTGFMRFLDCWAYLRDWNCSSFMGNTNYIYIFIHFFVSPHYSTWNSRNKGPKSISKCVKSCLWPMAWLLGAFLSGHWVRDGHPLLQDRQTFTDIKGQREAT